MRTALCTTPDKTASPDLPQDFASKLADAYLADMASNPTLAPSKPLQAAQHKPPLPPPLPPRRRCYRPRRSLAGEDSDHAR